MLPAPVVPNQRLPAVVLKPAVYIAVNGIKMPFGGGEIKLGAFGGSYFYVTQTGCFLLRGFCGARCYFISRFFGRVILPIAGADENGQQDEYV